MRLFFLVFMFMQYCFATKCPPGSYATGNACTLFDIGMYENTQEPGTCQVCPENTEARVKGSTVCSVCRTGTHKPEQNSVVFCRICQFGYYMNDGMCFKCQSLHSGYCDALAQNLLDDDFRVDFSITACRQYLAIQNKVVLCDTCNCSISGNSMNVSTSPCNNADYYMSSLTRDCEYYPPSYYIVRNHAGNLCVPFSTPVVGKNIHGQCIPGYFRVKDTVSKRHTLLLATQQDVFNLCKKLDN